MTKSYRSRTGIRTKRQTRRLAPPSQQAKEPDRNVLPTYQYHNQYENEFEPVPITFYYVVFPQGESQNEPDGATNNSQTHPHPLP
ncbi:hypothetical protein KDRO_A05070 [Kluyveromyces lactis]|nr:hypothetical protein KDRO_A05070 [Kluyveromyces lactis]